MHLPDSGWVLTLAGLGSSGNGNQKKGGGGGEGEEEAVWCSPVLLPRSIITSDEVQTTSIWQTEEDGNENIRFEISNDLSRALVTLHVPGKVTGKLTLTSHNLRCLPETEDEAKGSAILVVKANRHGERGRWSNLLPTKQRSNNREGDGRVRHQKRARTQTQS